jgi:hypothetical protein
MEKSTDGFHEHSRLLARELIGKLAVISACCDLLGTNAQPSSESAKRLGLIREMVEEIAEGLQQHQCQVLEAFRSAGGRKRYVA